MPHKRSYYGYRKREIRFLDYMEHTAQRDAIRAEIKDHSPRDIFSGEKAFSPTEREAIKKLLLAGGCSVEKINTHYIKPVDRMARHVTIHTEQEWLDFDSDTIEHMLQWIEDGQVLNRPA